MNHDAVTGHRMVTDMVLLGGAGVEPVSTPARARQHAGRLATFDRRLARTHPDVADLIPI